MIDWLLSLFGCKHQRTTFPLTREGYTYTVCLDCGREFEYLWQEMKRKEA